MRHFIVGLWIIFSLQSCKASQSTQCDVPASEDCPTQTTQTTSSTNQPPSTSGQGLFINSISGGSLTLQWDQASDNETPQSLLFYAAYVSPANPAAGSFDEVSEVEAGTQIVSGTALTSATFSPSAVPAGTTYQFNVIVIDQQGNKSVYRPRGEMMDTSLIFYWPFDGHTNDISPMLNHLMYFDGIQPFLYDVDRFGVAKGAGNIQVTDGTTRSATLKSSQLLSNASLTSNASRTFVIWVKPRLYPLNSSVPAQMLFLYGSSGTNSGFGLRYNGFTNFMSGSNSSVIEGVVSTEWIQWVIVYDGATMTFYKNGLFFISAGIVLSTPSSTFLTVGRADNSFGSNLTEYFDGAFDDFQVFGRALTGAEIGNLYQAQRAL
jgi:hypothetical protein